MCVGVVLLIYCVGAVFLSGLADLQNLQRASIAGFVHVGLGLLAGVIYLVGMYGVLKKGWWVGLWVLFGVGLVMRVVLCFSQPILQDDYHRYLWDGAIVVNGYNPYATPPRDYNFRIEEMGEGQLIEDDRMNERFELRPMRDVPFGEMTFCVPETSDGPKVHEKINHPHLTTIYPPVSQLFFGLSHVIAPYSITGLRVLLLICEVVSFLVLLKLLGQMKLPGLWVVIYWWNPLVIMEIINEVHIEGFVFPFVLLGVWMAIRGQLLHAMMGMVVGIGVKLYPLLLAPLVLKTGSWNPRPEPGRDAGKPVYLVVLNALLLVGFCVVMIYPMVYSHYNPGQVGLLKFGTSWENNAGIYALIRVVGDAMFMPGVGFVIARVVTVVITLGLLMHYILKPFYSYDEMVRRMVLLMFVFFLFSPTQFPWYYTWVLPLCVLRPAFSILLYTPLLALYDLHYAYPGVQVIEHFPVVVWLCVELKREVWLIESRAVFCEDREVRV